MKLNRRILGSYLSLLMFVSCGSLISSSQAQPALHADRIEAQIVGTKPNSDDPSDLVVSVLVTVYAGERALVIPDCAEKETERKWFCSAQLARKNGKTIGIRKGLLATLGMDAAAPWKPITIPPGGHESFGFDFETGLMAVRSGESVKVKFQVWSDPQSIQNWKVAANFLSPAIQVPIE